MGKEGKLFVLTGIDGSGKATQTRLLVEKLRNQGMEAAIFDFPQYENGFFGRLAARYLRGEFGDAAEVNPYLASMIYAADRWEARDRIIRSMEEGGIVVCNRYVCDNMAHQGAKLKNESERKRFYGWLEEMEYSVYGLPHADLVIFFDVPVDAAGKLIDKKGARGYLEGEDRDMHERNLDHLSAARQAYLELAKTYFNWVRVECMKEGEMQPPERIAESVWREITRHLNG